LLSELPPMAFMLSTIFGASPSEEAIAALDAVVTALTDEELVPVAASPSERDVQLLAQLRHWTSAWRWMPAAPPPVAHSVAVKAELLSNVRWKHIGFQREQPLSDVRACGRLALTQMLSFVQSFPATASQMAERQYVGRQLDVSRSYPWAAASVNATMMILALLGMQHASLWARQTGCAFPGTRALQSRRRARCAFSVHSLDDVHSLHALAIQMVDQAFQRLSAAGGGYMQFGQVLRDVHDELLTLLLHGASCNVKDVFDAARGQGWHVVGPVTAISATGFSQRL